MCLLRGALKPPTIGANNMTNEPQQQFNYAAHMVLTQGATIERLQVMRATWDALQASLVPVDPRPENCRERLREEGKSYPRSRCFGCGMSARNPKNCPHQ